MGQAKLRGSPDQRTTAAKEQIISPIKVLNALSSNYSGIWKFVECGALERKKNETSVFLHYYAWAAILANYKYSKFLPLGVSKQVEFSLDKIPDYIALADVGTWRYTKGVYRINNDVAEYLLNSEFKGNIPTDKISKLPEWSIYVDCTNLSLLAFDRKIIGFWASINYLKFDQEKVLHFTPLYEDTFGSDFSTCIRLDVGQDLSIEADTALIQKHFKQQPSQEAIKDLNTFKKKALQIILFICQDEPDIFENGNEIDEVGFKPVAQRIKGEVRLFEAKKVRYFDVGVKTGALIKDTFNAYRASGKTQAPHIRRAHWHGFWRGSRKNNAQEFFYKWVAPVIVNGDLVPADQPI